MACRHRSLLLASLALVLRRWRRRQEENKKHKRSFWAGKIFTKERKVRSEWENPFRELSNNDWEYYYRYLLMIPEHFEYLFNLVGPLIAKQDTNYRKSTPAKKRLVYYASLFSRRLFTASIESVNLLFPGIRGGMRSTIYHNDHTLFTTTINRGRVD